MGLDVYLYRFENYAADKAREAEYEKESELVYATGEDNSEAAREDRRARLKATAARLGLNDHGGAGEKIEQPSATYPDHYFKVGYFRSSYNEGGINRVLAAKDVWTLGEIFEGGEAYEFQPNWARAKDRAAQALAALREANAAAPYRAMFVGKNIFSDASAAGPKDEYAALTIFNRVRGEHSAGAGRELTNFGNRDGEFMLGRPLEMRAAIPGAGVFGEPGVWIVYKEDAEDMNWYEHALEIVIETCDYVLAQAHPEQFWLHWSS